MDDLRLYRRVLTQEEVRRIATMPGKDGPVGRDKLIGWWKFDETRGQTFADSSGNSNHARPKADADGAWLVYAPDPSTLRQGDNDLVIQAARPDRSTAPTRVTAVELHVTYK